MSVEQRPKPARVTASPRYLPLLIGAMIAVAFVLRAAFLGDREPFRDEGASWLTASFSLADLVSRVAHEAYPPLYAVLLKLWSAGFGDGLLAIRFPSVLAGLAVAVVGWRWAHEAHGWRVGVIALAILAISPFAIQESRDARMYALMNAFSAASWWLAWRLAAGRVQGRAAQFQAMALALAVAGELWTSAYGIPTAGLQLLAVLIGARYGSGTGSRLAVAAIVAASLSFLPWAPNLLSFAAGSGRFWTPRPDLGAPLVTYSRWLTDGYVFAIEVGEVAFAAATAALVMALLRPGTRAGFGPAAAASPGDSAAPTAPPASGVRLYGLFATLSLGVLPIVWLGSQVHPAYDTRYFGAVLPALAGGLGLAVVRILGAGPVRWRDGLPAVPLVLLLGVSVNWVSTWIQNDGIAPSTAVARTLATEMRPGDIVIAADSRSYFPIAYLADRSTDPVRLPGPVLCWDSGSQPFYFGTALVPDSVTVFASRDLRTQLAALGLGPNGRIWLVAIANGKNVNVGFAPLEDGSVTQLDSQIVQPASEPGQIRELVLLP